MELSAQGTLPTAGGDMNAEPITNTFNHIMSQVNGNNLDENNVDYSGADGIMVLARTQTRTAALTVLNTVTVGVDDTGHDVKFFGATTGKSFLWDESADKLIITGDFSVSGTTSSLGTVTTVDINGGTVDGVTIGGASAGAGTFTTLAGTTNVVAASDITITSGSIVSASGAITFSNENLSTTGTLSSGATTVTSLKVSANDGGAIGASGTAFSDLFLASGGVINFAAGNMLATHATGTLAITGGLVGVAMTPVKTFDVTGEIRASTGILFGTDTAAANTLDDYEEGTWTPAFAATGNAYTSLTYGTQSGTYTKVGRLVVASCSVISNSTPASGTGTLTITGLPFAAAAGNQVPGYVGFQNNFTAETNQADMLVTVEPSTTVMDVRYAEYSGTSGMGGMNATSLHNANPRILVTVVYHV